MSREKAPTNVAAGSKYADVWMRHAYLHLKDIKQAGFFSGARQDSLFFSNRYYSSVSVMHRHRISKNVTKRYTALIADSSTKKLHGTLQHFREKKIHILLEQDIENLLLAGKAEIARLYFQI